MSDMLKANCFLPSIIIPHITMTKANSEFKNSLAHEFENSKFLDFSDLNVSSVRGIFKGIFKHCTFCGIPSCVLVAFFFSFVGTRESQLFKKIV